MHHALYRYLCDCVERLRNECRTWDCPFVWLKMLMCAAGQRGGQLRGIFNVRVYLPSIYIYARHHFQLSICTQHTQHCHFELNYDVSIQDIYSMLSWHQADLSICIRRGPAARLWAGNHCYCCSWGVKQSASEREGERDKTLRNNSSEESFGIRGQFNPAAMDNVDAWRVCVCAYEPLQRHRPEPYINWKWRDVTRMTYLTANAIKETQMALFVYEWSGLRSQLLSICGEINTFFIFGGRIERGRELDVNSRQCI